MILTYFSLNPSLSLYQDVGWRKRLVKGADLPMNGIVLDLCTGTGDLALGFLTQRPELKGLVYAIDFSALMLDKARGKVALLGAPYPRRVDFLMGDALDTQFPDEKFDVVSVGFGVRNLADTRAGLREIHRVLKVGGQADILEFFSGGILSRPVKCCLDSLVPWIGNIISRSRAYTYLRHTSDEFYTVREFEELLKEMGFGDITWERMTFGIAHIVRARKV